MEISLFFTFDAISIKYEKIIFDCGTLKIQSLLHGVTEEVKSSGN
jgi:hypothetical protein